MMCYEKYANVMRDDCETVPGNYISMKGAIFQENMKSKTTKSIILILKLKCLSKFT